MKMTEEKEVLIFVASSTLGEEIGKKFSDTIKNKLEEKGIGKYFFGSISNPELVKKLPQCQSCLILVATGGTEDIIAEAGNKAKNIYLYYHDSYNSLPATLESSAYLRQLGKPVHLHKYENAESFAERVEKLIRAILGANKLRGCKFGIIGGISSWLIYSKASPELIKRKIGAELIEIPLQELLEEFDKRKVSHSEEDIVLKAREITVNKEEIWRALAVHESLEEIKKRYRLCGLTVKCFDLIMARKTTACLSMSLMNTKTFPAACEGDIPLLISMALGEYATGKPAFMGNPSRVSENELLIAHCTAPLISSFKLTTHFESGLGVGVSVEYPVDQEATIFRIDSKLERLRVGVGKVKRWDWRTDLCRTQVLLEIENAEKILKDSIGNHYALILGNFADEIIAAGETLGLKTEIF